MGRLVRGCVVALVVTACGGKIDTVGGGTSSSSSSGSLPVPRDEDEPPQPPRPPSLPPGAPSGPTCATMQPREGGALGVGCATWSPTDRQENIVIEGARVTTTAGSLNDSVRGSFGLSSGRRYFEVQVESLSGMYAGFGLASAAHSLELGFGGSQDTSCGMDPGGQLFCPSPNPGSDRVVASGLPWNPGSRIGIAVDLDAGFAWFAVDGTWVGCEGSPAATPMAMPLPRARPLYPLANVSAPDSGGADVFTQAFTPISARWAAPPGFTAGWCR